MHSRTALALVGALGLTAAGVLESLLGAPQGPGAALAQVLATPTRFVPRPAPSLVLPTPIPTPGLPGGFPLVPSPTAPASPTAVAGTPTAPPVDRAGPPPATSPTAVAPAGATATPEAAPPPPASEAPPAEQSPEAQPPAIQLRFGTAIYDGVRGSYCWTPPPAAGEPAAPGRCVDVVPPAFDTVLAWPAGEPLEFVINDPAPTTLTLTVYSRPTDPVVLQTELPAATSVTWQPTVAPGAYVFAVAARWPQGEVTYYFPVGILASGAPDATAPTEPEFASGDGVVGPAAGTPPPMPTGVPTPRPTAAPAPTTGTSRPSITSTTPLATPTRPAVPALTPPPAPSRITISTPAIAPTPAAAAPPAPDAGDRVLLHDDFTDPSSGLPLQSRDPTARRLGYRDGEYLVVRLAGSGGEAFVAYPEAFDDFQAEIDARLVPPTEDGYVFLDFRRQENGDYYSFLVDPNAGRFLLLRHTGDDRRLIDWTAAAAIQPGAATNRLGVRARGSTIVLLLGGTEVGRAQDGALRDGWVGFGVGSLADERAEGRFSHLLVTAVE